MNHDNSSVDIVIDGRIECATDAIAFSVHETVWRQDRAAYDRIRASRLGRGAVREIDPATAFGPEALSSQLVVLAAGTREIERRRSVHAQDVSQGLEY
jgi:hypothetical protein